MSEISLKSPSHSSCSPALYLDGASLEALDNALMPIMIGSDNNEIVLINRAATDSTGYTTDELTEFSSWLKLMHLDETPGGPTFIELFNEPKIQEIISVQFTGKTGETLSWDMLLVPLCRPDSRESSSPGYRSVLLVATGINDKIRKEQRLEPLMAELEHRFSGRVTDLSSMVESLKAEVAERDALSRALDHSRERLKRMSRHTLDILEADRRTISRDLHDSIGASLAAIKFSLEEKELYRTENDDCLSESLDKEINYLLETIKETKRISAHLRPTILDDLGLLATIEWYVRQFRRLYKDISINFSADIVEEDIPEPIKINIYRIIQEGLSNAERHGEASHIDLSLKFCDGKNSISLMIKDNGQGFDTSSLNLEKDPMSGYGLIAMRERCELFGGSFHLDSKPARGTRINAILPLSLIATHVATA